MDLFAWQIYMVFVLLALVGYTCAASKTIAIDKRMGLALVALALLGFGATGLRANAYLVDGLDPALEGRDLRVTGVVANLPQRSEAGLRFRFEVESATLDGQRAHLPPRLDVAWYGESALSVAGLSRPLPNVQAGERWAITLRVKAPHGTRNPHGFDYELWLWEQGVQATGYVRAGAKDPAPQRLAQTWRYPVALARQIVRGRINAQVAQHQTAGVLAALVVGDQAAIERADWDVFRATGVAHLVSISGLHITMFAWGAALLVGWLWRRSGALCTVLPAPQAALLGGVLLATGYAVFSGWGVPAQRTCLMLATVALLRLSGARWPWFMVWMLACAVVVAFDPWALLQSGFWLSFVAVGVLFATDSGAYNDHSTRANGLKGKLLSGLREQWVITVALTPLSLLLFGQASLVGLLANLVAIPWVTLVVTPLAMAGVVLPWLWDVAAGAMGWLLAYLQWLASWPWAVVTVAVPPLWVAVAGVLGGVALVLPWQWSMRLLGVPLLLPVLLWRAPVPAAGQFELLAADIGQGNAVLVRTARHALLYDAGPRYSLESDAGHRVLVPLLQALQVRLDTVVLSHRDMDHVGGASAVLTQQPQATVISSIEADNPLQTQRAIQRCVAGQHWEWDGVAFDILHPQDADYDTPAKSNAMSCVLRISNGAQTALLVGDIEQPQEARLMEQGANLKATVLLVPHHGSKTSSSGVFLDAVAPQTAIVQSGYRNRFGHPAPVVLERYQERSITVVDSPHCGAYTWQSWQAQNGACMRVQGLRYWHHRVP
ncbi:DNA internalization-related competence protein ComEC/Rec2 [Candidatus Aalborgicola defluviihabitans]|uniref:DNA internalization-related competence protein ComEC/Rec2 n=1 Tax=Candidatus Aalborgicola defluviihabitans TaxID=3386187 RepID=UPI001ED04F3A|nr:DNA internalization-related competence protein ComEC/Rec2 [Burkholderiales bacterium]